MGKYVVIARSRASAVFYPGDSFSLDYKRTDGETFKLIFRTQYLEGYEAPLPKDLWVEAWGPARDLDDAANVFVNAALEISAIIAFVTNASLGRPTRRFQPSPPRSPRKEPVRRTRL